jgi:hypothetical protein
MALPVRHRRQMPWTQQQRAALMLLFEGRTTLDTIAKVCEVPPRTLDDWISHPDFQAKLVELHNGCMDELISLPFIRKTQRLISLSVAAQTALQCFEDRPTLPDGRFNATAFHAFRAALDDIAKETGDRRPSALVKEQESKPNVVFYIPELQEPPEDCAKLRYDDEG